MQIKLEKDTAWRNGQSITQYFVWADDRCVEIAYSEEEALLKYENVKVNYVNPSKEVIKEETI